MPVKFGLIYSDLFASYDFGVEHPLKPYRFVLPYKLMDAYGLLNYIDVYKPVQAAENDIALVHDTGYIDCVKSVSKAPELFIDDFPYIYGLGYGDNPIFKGMYDVACIHVGGTILGSEIVAKGEREHVFSIGGGFHHAMPTKASGFCIFNDIAIAIRRLQSKYNVKKIMYIDIDAHHADGVQNIFYTEQSVLTVSIHESGNFLFPGTGFVKECGTGAGKGFAINIPLPMGTDDNAYLYAFNTIVPSLAYAYKPEILFMQCGADAHYLDPLAHLSLTTFAYKKIYSAVHKLAHEVCDGKLIAVGGGGYDVGVLSRVFTLLVSELIEVPVTKPIPDSWKILYKKTTGSAIAPDMLEDRIDIEKRKFVFDEIKEVVETIKKDLFKYHK